LWNEWSTIPDLAAHAQSLKARYEVRIEYTKVGVPSDSTKGVQL